MLTAGSVLKLQTAVWCVVTDWDIFLAFLACLLTPTQAGQDMAGQNLLTWQEMCRWKNAMFALTVQNGSHAAALEEKKGDFSEDIYNRQQVLLLESVLIKIQL